MKMSAKSWVAREMFGNFLKESREILDMSIYDVGYVLGVSHGTVGYWEQGKSFPGSPLMLKKMAFVFLETQNVLRSVLESDGVKPSSDEWDRFQRTVCFSGSFTIKDVLRKPDSADKRVDLYKRGFGDYLRRVRLDAGITGVSLAEGLGVLPGTYFQWESGVNFPREITVLGYLDKMYGDTLDVLFGLCRKNGISLRVKEKQELKKKLREFEDTSLWTRGKNCPSTWQRYLEAKGVR